MDELRRIIDQYPSWKNLSVFLDRIETYSREDFSLALGNAKALLESIGKEICKQKEIDLGSNPSMNAVLKRAYAALGHSRDDSFTQISTSLATIGQRMGELRNQSDVSSHGKTLDEVENRNQAFNAISQEMLLGSTELVGAFMIAQYEIQRADKPETSDISYLDCSEFNENWDESFGEFEMGNYSYSASEILFNVDYRAYETEFHAYQTGDE